MTWYECTSCNKILKNDEVDWVFHDDIMDEVPICSECYSECEEIDWSPSLVMPDEDISY